MTTFTVLVADPEAHSGIRAAAERAAHTITRAAGTVTDVDLHVVDLAELGPALLASDPASGNGAVATALDTVTGTDFLLIATPQVHGGYTGLLKVFLDRLPELGLAQAVAVPMAVVDDLRNGRNVEEDLRVVLSELGARVLEPGLLLARSELGEPHQVIGAWAEIAAPVLRQAATVAA